MCSSKSHKNTEKLENPQSKWKIVQTCWKTMNTCGPEKAGAWDTLRMPQLPPQSRVCTWATSTVHFSCVPVSPESGGHCAASFEPCQHPPGPPQAAAGARASDSLPPLTPTPPGPWKSGPPACLTSSGSLALGSWKGSLLSQIQESEA